MNIAIEVNNLTKKNGSLTAVNDVSFSIGKEEIIGVQLQSTTFYEKIRVKEAVDLLGSYYQ